MKIFGRELSFGKIQDVSKQRPELSDVRRIMQKPLQQIIRIRQDIQRWRNAMQIAESTINPQRFQLLQVYKDVVLDAHLTACMQQRKNLTLSKEFCVINSAGDIDDEKTLIIQSKWFRDFIDLSLDSLFYGHSLIQFGDLDNDVFKTVDLIPRQYVKPEFHIVTETYASTTGLDYLDSPYKEWCIGVGQSHDLGLLLKASPLVIWKKNAIGAWSEFQEMFGTPTRIGKTNVRDEVSRVNMENMLKNMGVAAWGVFDTDDLLELVETNKSDAHQVYNELIQRCNSEIAKLILGQTSTTDEKAFVGSAEVHERILASYAELDEHFIHCVLNYQLIPLMNGLGMGFEGFKIQSKEDEELTLDASIKIDAEIMKYFDVDPEYILQKYGTPVEKKAAPTVPINSVQNKLNKLYS